MEEETKTKEKVEMIAHEPEHDDREDLVEITYGDKAKDYKREMLKKQAAIDRLYAYYSRTSMKLVPKNDVNGKPVNSATCYVKFKRTDWATGEMIESYRDLPLWIVVDRMINHSYQITLVTKQEHDKYFADRQKPEDELSAKLLAERQKGVI